MLTHAADATVASQPPSTARGDTGTSQRDIRVLGPAPRILRAPLGSAPTRRLRPGRLAEQARLPWERKAQLGTFAGDGGGGRGQRELSSGSCPALIPIATAAQAGPLLSSCAFFSPASFRDVCPHGEMRGASRMLPALDCGQGLPLVTGALGTQDLGS